MTLERRFGVALFVLGLGNGLLALGNLVAGGQRLLIAMEAGMALAMAGLGYSFVYGDSELTVGDRGERVIAYVTILVAAVGVALALFGFYMVVAL